MRQRFLLSPLLFNIVLEFLTTAIKQGKEAKGIQTIKIENKTQQKEVKLPLSTNDMILHVENLKEPKNPQDATVNK